MKQEGINVFSQQDNKNNFFFFDELKKELVEGKRCYNCEFLGDVISIAGHVKDATIECLGVQSGISNIKLSESCSRHKFLDGYLKKES